MYTEYRSIVIANFSFQFYPQIIASDAPFGLSNLEPTHFDALALRFAPSRTTLDKNFGICSKQFVINARHCNFHNNFGS